MEVVESWRQHNIHEFMSSLPLKRFGAWAKRPRAAPKIDSNQNARALHSNFQKQRTQFIFILSEYSKVW
jgi:hypothetical protein